MVDAALSLADANEEEAAEDEAAVDVVVLVAETTTGVEDAMDAAAVLEAEAAVDPSGALEALVEVSGRGEVVEAVCAATRRAFEAVFLRARRSSRASRRFDGGDSIDDCLSRVRASRKRDYARGRVPILL